MTTPAPNPPDKPLNRRQQAKAATVAKVLASARALFDAGGYHAASIRDIAAHAGLSTGSIFANFPNKDAVWSAVYGGPPPSPFIADEIARTLGELPGYEFWISHAGGKFAASITAPTGRPGDGRWMETAAGPASALRAAREAAVAAAASDREAA